MVPVRDFISGFWVIISVPLTYEHIETLVVDASHDMQIHEQDFFQHIDPNHCRSITLHAMAVVSTNGKCGQQKWSKFARTMSDPGHAGPHEVAQVVCYEGSSRRRTVRMIMRVR